jgi:hypothetical protein
MSTPIDLQDIHLQSGEVVNKIFPINIEEENEEETLNK